VVLQQQQTWLELLRAGPVLGKQHLDVSVALLQLPVWVGDAEQPALPADIIFTMLLLCKPRGLLLLVCTAGRGGSRRAWQRDLRQLHRGLDTW
jgi:hypothetical protein